jgi:hypothetical protein
MYLQNFQGIYNFTLLHIAGFLGIYNSRLQHNCERSRAMHQSLLRSVASCVETIVLKFHRSTHCISGLPRGVPGWLTFFVAGYLASSPLGQEVENHISDGRVNWSHS